MKGLGNHEKSKTAYYTRPRTIKAVKNFEMIKIPLYRFALTTWQQHAG